MLRNTLNFPSVYRNDKYFIADICVTTEI